jgi:chorismate mutase/prephenate dehydratase
MVNKLDDLRLEIDEIDDSIVDLLAKRMKVSEKIAESKRENNLPILDRTREREKLMELSKKAEPEMEAYTRILYSLLFDMSKEHQHKQTKKQSLVYESFKTALENTVNEFPKNETIACQGIEGAYAQMASDKFFDVPCILYMKSFEGVFAAIENGLCKYGVLPLENSTAGSVNKIYDLMMKYNFHIVRCARIKIDHNLLVKEGTKLEDIKEIVSHEQAFLQCSEYMKKFKNIKITICENTAVAAKMVRESERNDLAALSSYTCAELYELDILASSVQNSENNYTKFICISKDLEIYPGADKTSLMMVIPNKPGALYKVLSRFFVLGINLIKLESRPIKDRDFEYMFYFDVDGSVYSESFNTLISELDDLSEEVRYLGSYMELI